MTSSTTWLTEVTLPRPAEDWSDRSLLAFAGPRLDGELPPSVTVSRDERDQPGDPAGETLDAYVQRQGKVLEASLPGFQVRRPTPLGVGTERARDTLFSWRSGAVSLTQWVVWMSMPDGSILTYTATSESSRFPQHRALFEATLPRIGIDPAAFTSA